YRDYVIEAFNTNMPYDRFTREQIAGDQLPNPTLQQKVASGYNRLLQTTHEGGAQDKEYLAIYAADRVRNFSSVWMGATVGCAQCHDHKYDPYSMKDFYSLAAFFADINERGDYKAPNSVPTKRLPEIMAWSAAEERRMAELEKQIAEKEKQNQPADDLKKELEALRKAGRLTMITQTAKPRVMRVLNRGDWMDETGEVVQPAVPHFMRQITGEDRATRLDLVEWLMSEDNPQTARTFVNRLWQMLFGIGISKRLDDLGAQGEWPVHPALLDALAVSFRESGWDIKQTIKLMVMSRAYRQSSLAGSDRFERDPYNRFVGRQNRFRVQAEMIRDTALAVSGLLVDKVGGPSVKPYQPEGLWEQLA
ncbi:MAG: DUF1549 and DUF1553 domain-containing protein, partial [Verrucomicrobiota bacterium]